uniref:UvrB/UvrC motif-containing protein n=1 Tax=Phenylobacterium glaciei TaxID=2803784 RepID=A0A974P0N1_9CAUL|nr:UvrB/UvrC motif-containing protein [Phenylobacterium glaciei]
MTKTIAELQREMAQAMDHEEYELAAKLRDQIAALTPGSMIRVQQPGQMGSARTRKPCGRRRAGSHPEARPDDPQPQAARWEALAPLPLFPAKAGIQVVGHDPRQEC